MRFLNNSANIFCVYMVIDYKEDFRLHVYMKDIRESCRAVKCFVVWDFLSTFQAIWHSWLCCLLMINSISPIIVIIRLPHFSQTHHRGQYCLIWGLLNYIISCYGLFNVGSTETHMISGSSWNWRKKCIGFHVCYTVYVALSMLLFKLSTLLFMLIYTAYSSYNFLLLSAFRIT